jgi:integral membrane protein (TIGR01906 family)
MIMTTLAETKAFPRWRVRIARTYLTAIFPVLLVLIGARLVMTPLFLQFEYNRSDFPPDPYGFTREDRLNYAPYALNYLLNGAGIEYLGDLKFPDDSTMFQATELRHMRDVKVVTQAAFGIAFVGGIIAIAAGVYLARTDPLALRRALLSGALFTLAIVVAIIVVAVASWDSFFITFHELFFQNGTWYFPTSDTLIRLFPEQFWFDAALVIGAITVLGALVTFVTSWRIKSA